MVTADPTLERLKAIDEQYFAARSGRDVESSYGSGEATRMNPAPRGIDPLGSDANYHYRSEHNYFLHVERGRAAVRNHPLVEQGINRLIANLRLDGFTLDVDSGDEAYDADEQADWRAWTGETQAGRNLCDYEGQRSFQQLARQSFFNRCSDGDIVHVPLFDGKIQTWESHHIRSPYGASRLSNSDQDGMVHGAEVRGGKTVAYWLTPHNVPFYGSLTQRGQSKRFPVFDASGNRITFWMGFTHRFAQRRGISRLSPPRDAMTGFDDLNYANTKSALRRSLIAYLMEDNPNAMPVSMPGAGSAKVPQSGMRRLGVQTEVIEQSGEPAQIIKAPDGKTLTGWNQSIPTQAFFEHASLMLTMLAVNLDLPLSFLLLDGSKTNFHGARSTFDQVKLRLKQLQQDEIRGLWGPTYEWRIRRKLTSGNSDYDPVLADAYRRGKFNPFNYTFRPRGWPYVKPAEDVAAEKAAVDNNLRSLREVVAERTGEDHDVHMRRIIGDRASWIRYSVATARNIAEKNSDLEINVLGLARELRYGMQSTENETVSIDQVAAESERIGSAEQSSPATSEVSE